MRQGCRSRFILYSMLVGAHMSIHTHVYVQITACLHKTADKLHIYTVYAFIMVGFQFRDRKILAGIYFSGKQYTIAVGDLIHT